MTHLTEEDCEDLTMSMIVGGISRQAQEEDWPPEETKRQIAKAIKLAQEALGKGDDWKWLYSWVREID